MKRSPITQLRTLANRHRHLLSVGASSSFQITCLSVLSFALAKILQPEDFGITRTVAAYFLVAIMCGHICMHDAIATYVAGSSTDAERKRYVFNGIMLVTGISATVMLLSEILILSGFFWQGTLQKALAIVFLFLPFAALTPVLNNLLQATGAHRRICISLIAGGLIPMICIIAASHLFGLRGWTTTKSLSFLLIFLVATFLTRHLFTWQRIHTPAMRQLLNFSKYQFSSGVVSMLLQSAPVIALDRLCGQMDLIGYFGLGILFVNASMFTLHTINLVYFKQMAEAVDNPSVFWIKALKLLGLGVVVCLLVMLGVNVAGPWLIHIIFGHEYDPSIHILRISSLSILLFGIWTIISMLNVVIKQPRFSLIVSVTGVSAGALMLWLTVPVYTITGAAWSMNTAYAVGSITGIIQLVLLAGKQLREAKAKQYSDAHE